MFQARAVRWTNASERVGFSYIGSSEDYQRVDCGSLGDMICQDGALLRVPLGILVRNYR
jgi:hypothetical protein